MKLAEAVSRIRLLEDTVERLMQQMKRVQEAMRHTQAVGVWTDCVEQTFERELAAINRQLKDAKRKLNRLREVEVDSELIDRAYQGRRP